MATIYKLKTRKNCSLNSFRATIKILTIGDVHFGEGVFSLYNMTGPALVIVII